MPDLQGGDAPNEVLVAEREVLQALVDNQLVRLVEKIRVW
jgi:hypothetical protein